MKKRTLLGLSTLVVAVSSLVTALSAGAAQSYLPFLDDLSSYNTARWRKADWTNGPPWNCGYLEQNITHNGGAMKLELDDTNAGGYDYSCAEYQTKKEYGYGTYSAQIKASAESGVVTGFFVYHGPEGTPDHDEIDFEFLGEEPTQVQLNYFVGGVGGHEHIVDLGFDASTAYHTYTFKWEPDSIAWFVDGIWVRQVWSPQNDLPRIPGKIIVNHWTPDNGWAGAFSYPGTPIHSRVTMIQFTPKWYPVEIPLRKPKP